LLGSTVVIGTLVNGKLTYHLNSKLSGKNCSVEEGCEYFDNIVIPGINNKTVIKTIGE
jgi:hypothetical protein